MAERSKQELAEYFSQPVEDTVVVERSNTSTLLTPEALQEGRRRIEEDGEDIDDVAADLAAEEVAMLMELEAQEQEDEKEED
jgi:hypothetical protein